jgi:hypothetical protein
MRQMADGAMKAARTMKSYCGTSATGRRLTRSREGEVIRRRQVPECGKRFTS